MRLGKSPGNDGLTVEIYIKFWSLIKTHLIKCYNLANNHGEMTSSQKQAVITLTNKVGKDRGRLENWTPLSLSNADYKIASKAIAYRIVKTLPHLISISQTGYLKG